MLNFHQIGDFSPQILQNFAGIAGNARKLHGFSEICRKIWKFYENLTTFDKFCRKFAEMDVGSRAEISASASSPEQGRRGQEADLLRRGRVAEEAGGEDGDDGTVDEEGHRQREEGLHREPIYHRRHVEHTSFQTDFQQFCDRILQNVSKISQIITLSEFRNH